MSDDDFMQDSGDEEYVSFLFSCRSFYDFG